jgi:hypothetical protein
MRSGGPATIAFVAVAWAALHLAFGTTLIYHDSWIHNFPLVFHAARNDACGALPHWLFGVDSGYPTVIQAISTTIMQPFRLLAMLAMSCMDLQVIDALYVQKMQVYVAYLVFAFGMYVMGRVLFRARLSATYLFAATLFTGLSLQSAHSDQAVNIVFWIPWTVAAVALAARQSSPGARALYLNVAALLFCVQLLDQYPHFTIVAGGVGLALYLFFDRRLLVGGRALLVRLGPAVLFVVAAGIELWIVRQAIADYRPSLRADVVIDPRSFGETGFAQPTALIGVFFPTSFISAFDELAAGLRAWLAAHGVRSGISGFMYRLDSLFFVVGLLPALLAAAFLLSAEDRRKRWGWGLFSAAMLAISLQQSGLYLLMFRLPFFNVFRSYGLFLCHAVFGFLVLSAYGMDALASLTPEERRALARRALRWTGLVAITAALGFAVIGSLLSRSALLRTLGVPLLLDAALLGVSMWLFWRCLRAPHVGGGLVATVVGVQGLSLAAAYVVLGISTPAALEKMGADPAARAEMSALRPDSTRAVCRIFAQCYLSATDTTSLSQSLQGSFLRSREAALYQPGLAPPVVAALAGTTHPAFWTSANAAGYTSKEEMIGRLNAHQGDIGAYLQEAVQVTESDLPRLGSRATALGTRARIESIVRGKDEVQVRYESDRPFLMNAALTYDKSWVAAVDGRRAAVLRGNFDGLAVQVPAGSHTLVLSYASAASTWFFATRYVLVALGCAALLFLALMRPKSTMANTSSAAP